jgi:phosphatidate phosphatase PAH1
VYFQIPDDKKLDIGRHRVRMVVAGDATGADQYIEVLPQGAPVFVSDVDGTLTEQKLSLEVVCDEESDPVALLGSLAGGTAQPDVHEGAPALYSKLVGLGYRVLYLTARAEWLQPHTHHFLQQSSRGDGRGDLPEGLVHTTLNELPSGPTAASVFKQNELQMLRDKGLNIVFGFGDQGSDDKAYTAAQIPYGFYYQKTDTLLRTCSDITGLPLEPAGALQKGNWRHKAYGDLMPVFSQLIASCNSGGT